MHSLAEAISRFLSLGQHVNLFVESFTTTLPLLS